MAIPKVLLFDLGGVLVVSGGLQALPRLLPAPMPPEDLRRKWVTSPAVGLFEHGRCSEHEFAARFIEEWGLALDSSTFLEEFASWVTVPYAETAELLATLRSRHKLACLSNTNATHWKKLLAMDGLAPVLERPFLSHQLGLMKPSPEVFAHVARELGCEPGEIAFFDDGKENVDGAAKAGLSAHQTVGPAALRSKLQELGLL
jgi:glucose-1-phosphatase